MLIPMTSEHFTNKTEAELTRMGEIESYIAWVVPSGETLRYASDEHSDILYDYCEGESINVWFREMATGIEILRIECEEGWELIPHEGEGTIACIATELEKRSNAIEDGTLMADGSEPVEPWERYLSRELSWHPA